jgi:hypothetical protein
VPVRFPCRETILMVWYVSVSKNTIRYKLELAASGMEPEWRESSRRRNRIYRSARTSQRAYALLAAYT